MDINMVKNGIVSKKRINNNDYYYYQYYDNGNRKYKSISYNDAIDISIKLNTLNVDDNFYNYEFKTDTLIGSSLYENTKNISSYKKRYCYKDIDNYLNNDTYGKVLILYGLRRTGKTTLIMQSIADMSLKDLVKSAYIKVKPSNTFDELDKDLKHLIKYGFKYIFIDEITLLDDFISSSATLSDIYALNAKIILSGTDSLGFMVAKRNELFDRNIMIHTTYISYKEFCEVLGVNSIDYYIEYGGVMSKEGIDYNNVILKGQNYVNEYVDSAIATNISHSLKNYEDGSHFSSLYDLFKRGELTNIINRIVEDTNNRFVIETINNEFKSHDLGSLKDLIRKNKNEELRENFLGSHFEEITNSLMESLEIINKKYETNYVENNVLVEIKEYLKLLDLIDSYKIVNIVSMAEENRDIFIQPGLRYNQAKQLIDVLLKQENIIQLNISDKELLKQKLISDIKGKMIEQIIVYQTSKEYDAFKLLFPIGEYDMVVLDHKTHEADIYEIKYSTLINESHYRFLIDKDMNKQFENKYYKIRNRIVLYNGQNKSIDNIKYQNISEYLLNL